MERSDRRAVLVTGAGGGIGGCITRFLAERGHTVYAAVRKQAHADKLKDVPGVVPVFVDVTNAEQVGRASEEIAAYGTGLYGLVNNAGVGELGMLSTWDDADLQHIFDVNVFGPHRMTNAFLPLLVASGGGHVASAGTSGRGVKPERLRPGMAPT